MGHPIISAGLLFSFFLYALFLQVQVAAATCYARNGTEMLADVQPCKSEGGACCSINKHDQGYNDTCLDNGLCFSQDGLATGLFYEVGCTTSDWSSSECSFVCKDMQPVGHSYFVLPCPANSSVGAWCCSADGSDCCDDSFDMQMATLPTASQTSAPSCPSSTATSGGSSHSSGSKSTVAIGAGVGVSLGVCFLASLAGLFAQRRMYQRRLDEKDQLLNSQLAVGYTRSGIAEANQAGHDNAALLQRLNAGPRELEATKKTTTFELGSDGK